jgi:putative restriction endonuclease
MEPPVEEVNFWRPGSESSFKALQPGEPFFFKLKAPRNVIAGFGFFAHFSLLPVSMAWEVYGNANGARSYIEMRERLLAIRSRFDMDVDRKKDFWIGCILINQPVFFEEADWIRMPDDFAPNIVQGKGYDLTRGEGERIWLECLGRVESQKGLQIAEGSEPASEILGGYGAPMVVRPRLGQRSFRVAVLDSYGRRCAITNERTLPALEAAHIREFHSVQEHQVSNGILFRADIHKLFDAGYVTVAPDLHFLVSRKIKEEFENGRDYYRLHGTEIRLPMKPGDHPQTEALWWHNENRFLG